MSWPRKLTALCAIVVPLLGFGVYLAVAGGVVKRSEDAPLFRPPASEPALIAAYRADPMLTVGAPEPPTGPPQIKRVCDAVIDNVRYTVGYTEVSYTYSFPGTGDVPDLGARYGPSAGADGWVSAGDSGQVAAQFCRTVDGVASMLTIARSYHSGWGVVEVREITSVPAGRSCPFQRDLLGQPISAASVDPRDDPRCDVQGGWSAG